MKKEDLSQKPHYLKKAYRIGKNLAKIIEKDHDGLQSTRIRIIPFESWTNENQKG